MITIQELLYNRGLDRNAKVKLARHTDKRYPDLYEWYCSDKEKFLNYFEEQSKEVFKGVDFVIALLGEASTLARFVGVYKVNGVVSKIDEEGKGCFKYDLEEITGFEDLKERVIIDWGKGTAKWHHYIEQIKEVIEIHPGLHYTQFKNYSDVILNYSELKEIIGNSHKDWRIPLTVTNAIYLILDKKTGLQYVGSTYSKEYGILGRWSGYAKSGHNENKLLKKLFKDDENYADNFQWSILTLLSKNITEKEAITIETLYKKKLGARTFGLNGN